MANEETVKFQIRVSDDDMKALKHKAIDAGVSSSDLVRRAIRGMLTMEAAAILSEPIPVPPANGGQG